MALLVSLAVSGRAEAAAPPVDFARDVYPIFQKHCLSCHGPQRQKGGFRLDLKASALKGGGTHAPAIVPGNSEKSPLFQFAGGLDEDLVMPPNPEGRRTLSDLELGHLRAWIDQGAAWPVGVGTSADDPLAHWAYRPLTRPSVPIAPDDAFGPVLNPIDAFIAARLRASNARAAPEADRRTLIRRLSFDLHGLPASPEEIDAFVNNKAADAYEVLVDRLLAAPEFGERFARLWLDVAHFGESHGFGMDRPRQNAWPYRDYLINAFNRDVPYSRFVQEQVAADVLFPDESEKIPALGLVAAGPFNQSALAEQVDGTECKKIALNLDRDDMVSGVAATFLSLTVHCARCHDHKFDPISQADYYRLQAVFAGVGRAEREFDADPKVAARRRALLAERAAVEKNLEATTTPEMVEALFTTTTRTQDQKTLLARRHLRSELDASLASLPKPSRVYAIAGEFPAFKNYKPTMGPLPIRILKRGNVNQPLDPVKPGALSCVGALPFEFSLANPADEKERRAAFAHWLTDPANPLTWRSIANRVWQWHFGAGIVETPNDFGKNGGRPSHPELLDWLACSVRDGGGGLKALHRLMVTSAAYRRSSAVAPSPEDNDNRRHAHRNRLRLDAEQVRDALLSISGRLDPTMGGPSVMQFVFNDPNKEVSPRIDYAGFDPDSPTAQRRGVYRFLYRNVNDPLLDAFDAADPSLSTPRRNVTITPQQALSLWNNRFVLRQCEHLAARLEREAPDRGARLDRACQLAWGRPPRGDELDLLRRHAERHGLASACRVVLNANDFLFVH